MLLGVVDKKNRWMTNVDLHKKIKIEIAVKIRSSSQPAALNRTSLSLNRVSNVVSIGCSLGSTNFQWNDLKAAAPLQPWKASSFSEVELV